jgi:eukaryotic-like serine/threonine-protein kinase
MRPPRERASSASVESAPYDTREARALLQSRLRQFGKIWAAIGVLFLSIALVMQLTMPLEGSWATVAAQAINTLLGIAIWVGLRRRPVSTAVLHGIDAVGTLAASVVFIAMGWALPLWSRPDLIQIQAVTDVLVLRAFLVPSTPQRTALVSSAAVAGILISIGLMYAGARVHPSAPDGSAYVAVGAVLGLATILLTTLTSRTIFGLRQRVREAARLGQYTLLDPIGEGGMGQVFKARHAMLRRPTAIKLLPAERAGTHALARFEREVQLTSELTHPNTVSIYDYGRTADGIFYYAMEYLDGVDLQGLVDVDGPQPPGRVIHLLRQIAGALEEAHGVGLIHRDIKPANVILCANRGHPDFAKVLDFGLVKSLTEASDASSTAVGQLVGTPLYMSPEAISRPDEVGPRSDLYALGALGYFLLVGAPPFTGMTTLEVCGHHLHSLPVPPADRLGGGPSTRLDALLLACLAKQPAQRPDSATALLAALEACDDTPPWTGSDARAWWQVNGEKIAERRRERAAVAMAPGRDQSVAVDVRVRA